MNFEFAIRAKTYLTLAYILLFLVNAFIPNIILAVLMAPIAVLILVLALPKVSSNTKYLSIVLLFLGIILLFNSNAGWVNWVESLSKNAGITILLLCLPLLKIILAYEDFETPILNITRKYSKTPVKFYISTSLIIIFSGLLINVGSIPMAHQLLEKPMKKYPKKLFYEAATRSFTSNMFWSPNNVPVALVLQTLSLQWVAIAPYGLLIALMANTLSIFMVKITYKSWNTEFNDNIKENEFDNNSDIARDTLPIDDQPQVSELKDTFRILCIIFLLIFSVVCLSATIKKSILVIVPLLSILFPTIMAIVFQKTNIFKIKFKEFLDNSLPSLNDEFVLFTSISFFGYALGISDIIGIIPLVINQFGFNNATALLSFIIIFITLLAILGLHPVITITAIAAAYSKGGMPVTNIQMAIALMAGYTFHTVLSPFSGLTLVTTSLSKKSPFSVSLKLNYLYVFILSILIITILSFM